MAKPKSIETFAVVAVNETPKVASYFDVSPRFVEPIDHEFYAFTKQVCRVTGVVAVGCDVAGRRFYVRATKAARRSIVLRMRGNTWHCGDGSAYRIDVLAA